MLRSSIHRLAAVAAFVPLIPATIGGPALAQTRPYGHLGLYVDEARTSNSVSLAGAFTAFTMYVFCDPTSRGLDAAEFSLEYPANVIPADLTTNPLVSVSLGNIDTGVSVAFLECQTDWVWTHRQNLYLTSAEATRIEIEASDLSGECQVATCEVGHPLEPVFVSSLLCLNAECPPDTAAPLLLGAGEVVANSVVVLFSEALLEVSAQDPAHYEIAELKDPSITVSIVYAGLRPDGMSVALYASAPFSMDGRQYVVHVADVYDLWGNEVPSGSTCTFRTRDMTPPQLASASAEAETLVTAVFSEPVEAVTAANPSNYFVYNESALPDCHPYRATLIADDRVALSFEDPNILPSLITLTLKATNVKDVAGNVISSSNNTATFVTPDTRPPYVASIEIQPPNFPQNGFYVHFNEAVIDSTAENTGCYLIYREDDTLVTVPVSSAELFPTQRTVLLRLGSPVAVEVPYVLRVQGIEDQFGNRMAVPTFTDFVWPDEIGPIPLAAIPLTRSLIRLQFNEPLDEATAENKANYRMSETAASSIVIPISSAELEASADAVLLTLASAMKLDIGYTLRVLWAKDLKGNPSSGHFVTTVYPDTFPPVLTGVVPISASSLTLEFDEALSESSAENTTNYVLFETGNPSNVAGISLATLVEDGRRVQIALAANLIAGVSYTISASNITDLKGNVIPPGTSFVFIFGDNVPPALISASAGEDTAVLASFSERLDNVTAENPGAYLVYETADPGVTIPIATAALAEDSSKVLLSLGGTLAADVAYSLSATGVSDRAGNPLPAGSVVPITRPDTMPPHLSTVLAVDLTYVMVTFDEPVTAASAGTAANYLIYPVADPGSAIAISSVSVTSNTTAGLWLAFGLSYSTAYTLRVSNVTDLAGNVIAPGSEMNFNSESRPVTGSGYIGLFADAYHAANSVTQPVFTQFDMYVWCLAGSSGIMATEFSVSYPSNVIAISTTYNPAAAVWLGDITTGMSIGFGACQAGWIWPVRQTCLLLTSEVSTISLKAGPVFANCTVGYPLETARIFSNLAINQGGYIAALLQDYAASHRDGVVDVTWRLSQMDEGVRFVVLRAEAGSPDFIEAPNDIEANGLSFAYRDETVEPGASYRYRVDYMDAAGTHTLFETDPIAVPRLPLALNQNWPNPFNPSTTISYYLPEAGRVRLEIFDIAGHQIACLADRNEERGNHTAIWNGAGESGKPAATGIYICRLTVGRETLSRKMVLIR